MLAVAAGAVLIATLGAESVFTAGSGRLWPRGAFELLISDVLRNVVLFLPLGIGLAWLRVPVLAALALGFALSSAVELAQLVIPGRTGSPIDIAMNTAGTFAGYVAAYTMPGWVFPPSARARRLVLAAGVGAAAMFVLTGVLYEPYWKPGPWFGHWTPNFSYRDRYEGEVVSASINGNRLAGTPYEDLRPLRWAFEGDFAVELVARAGPRPSGQAPIFTITDGHGLHVVELAVDRGDDLVYQYESVGKRLGLEWPRIRLPRVLASAAPGDRLSLAIARRSSDYCLRVAEVETCGHGFRVGDGWRLFAPPFPSLDLLGPAVGAAWVALLCLPLGFWARAEPMSFVAGAIALAGLLLAPRAGPLLPTAPSEIAGAGLGVLLGVSLRALLGRGRAAE